jgi:hypothetical protein
METIETLKRSRISLARQFQGFAFRQSTVLRLHWRDHKALSANSKALLIQISGLIAAGREKNSGAKASRSPKKGSGLGQQFSCQRQRPHKGYYAVVYRVLALRAKSTLVLVRVNYSQPDEFVSRQEKSTLSPQAATAKTKRRKDHALRSG